MDTSSAGPIQKRTTIQTRRGSLILFKYVTVEFLVPLSCCVIGFLTLFVVTDLFDILRDLVDNHAPFASAVQYFALRQPANLVNVLPMSILLGASFTVHMLGRHHEILALRAAGLSLLRCFLPIWLIALLFTGLSLWLNTGTAVKATASAEELLDRLTSAPERRDTHRQRLAFRNNAGNRDWFFEAFSRTDTQYGVLIKQFRPDRTIKWELRAASACRDGGIWTFHDARLNTFDAMGALPEGPEQTFAVYSMPALDESPGQILNSLKPALELSVREIQHILRNDPNLPQSTRNVLLTTVWSQLSFPLACVIAAFLGVALSLSRERGAALIGFAVAVGIMVLYYIGGQFFVLLGKNGVVAPVVAGTLPTLAFAGWGFWEMLRKR
jgi:LPS export ABC transporter permease LptG